ncbi:MAG TPA: DNA-processing protein DprA [Gemmatimonadaceae bacterium]|nr:DNA-processing protein DprA [Gemmatimonadaceae bacterium]
MALTLLQGVGVVAYWRTVSAYGSAERAWHANQSEGRAEAWDLADTVLSRVRQLGARVLVPGDPVYPPALYDLHLPPWRLFALGNSSLLERRAVAIVGTRSATAYGERMARELAGDLARAGLMVISGLARGIDGVAHRAALECGGTTVAVLGTGLDIAYPASHRALQAEIARRGLLLTEELPGDRADGGSFPRRNRIIAALAEATIVVEAGKESGALRTAEHAIDIGRDVAAVPGPVDAPQSVGTNRLLRDGAIFIADIDDARTLMKLQRRGQRSPVLATAAEVAVWEALATGTTDVDTLVAVAGLPTRDCMAALTSLELAGAVECSLTGEIRRL